MLKKLCHRLFVLSGRTAFIVLYPFIALYLNRDERTRVILFNKGKVLLVKSWVGSGQWELPGGGLHKNESPAQGAVREVYEELGITIAAGELLALGSSKYSSGLIRNRLHFFLVRLSETPFIKLQRIEITEARWFPETDLAGLKIDNRHRQIIYDAKSAGSTV